MVNATATMNDNILVLVLMILFKICMLHGSFSA
jgi:hypothetical protein